MILQQKLQRYWSVAEIWVGITPCKYFIGSWYWVYYLCLAEVDHFSLWHTLVIMLLVDMCVYNNVLWLLQDINYYAAISIRRQCPVWQERTMFVKREWNKEREICLIVHQFCKAPALLGTSCIQTDLPDCCFLDCIMEKVVLAISWRSEAPWIAEFMDSSLKLAYTTKVSIHRKRLLTTTKETVYISVTILVNVRSFGHKSLTSLFSSSVIQSLKSDGTFAILFSRSCSIISGYIFGWQKFDSTRSLGLTSVLSASQWQSYCWWSHTLLERRNAPLIQ